MLEVADAAFFWQTPQELVDALGAVLAGDEACSRRRARWPDALRAQLHPLDGNMNERLYDYLVRRSVFRPGHDRV
jgi:hypothetical protein